MSAMNTPHTPEQSERRVHHKVRSVFAEACTLIGPAMSEAGDKAGNAMDLLRARYPELSVLEIHVLITAVARLQQPKTTC